jgi:hypothetical protein
MAGNSEVPFSLGVFETACQWAGVLALPDLADAGKTGPGAGDLAGTSAATTAEVVCNFFWRVRLNQEKQKHKLD